MFCREQAARFAERLADIRAAGGELVAIGNGSPEQAAEFRSALGLDFPVLSDPERVAYRLLGLRRNLLGVAHPRMLMHGLRAARGGHRQTALAGDGMQLGGVFVVAPGGELRYAYQSREAGDHPPIEEAIAALAA